MFRCEALATFKLQLLLVQANNALSDELAARFVPTAHSTQVKFEKQITRLFLKQDCFCFLESEEILVNKNCLLQYKDASFLIKISKAETFAKILADWLTDEFPNWRRIYNIKRRG